MCMNKFVHMYVYLFVLTTKAALLLRKWGCDVAIKRFHSKYIRCCPFRQKFPNMTSDKLSSEFLMNACVSAWADPDLLATAGGKAGWQGQEQLREQLPMIGRRVSFFAKVEWGQTGATTRAQGQCHPQVLQSRPFVLVNCVCRAVIGCFVVKGIFTTAYCQLIGSKSALKKLMFVLRPITCA